MNRFVTDIDATFMKDVFDFSQTERISNVTHDGEFDDFGTGFEIFEVISFCHVQS